jgi:hypothetical protein
LLFGLIGLACIVGAVAALRHRRLARLTTRLAFGLLFLTLASLFGTLAFATQGYRALTREEVAAVIETELIAPQRFRAKFRFPDGREASYTLAGDELYVDAHVLKWNPIVNILGLHTAYELDRVAGRYRQLSNEQRATRTVYALAEDKRVDMFDLRRRYTVLAPLLDAEYGSATFVPVEHLQKLEVRVSTTGLLIRPAGKVGNGSYSSSSK